MTSCNRYPRGLTLIEVLAALVIIGMASVVVVAAHRSHARARAAVSSHDVSQFRLTMNELSVHDDAIDASTNWVPLDTAQALDSVWVLNLEWYEQRLPSIGSGEKLFVRAVPPRETGEDESK